MVETPQGVVKARALLGTGASASFIWEHLAQSLCFTLEAINHLIPVSSALSSGRNLESLDLPMCIISYEQNWMHLEGLTLADPKYNQPGRINILLGFGTLVEV